MSKKTIVEENLENVKETKKTTKSNNDFLTENEKIKEFVKNAKKTKKASYKEMVELFTAEKLTKTQVSKVYSELEKNAVEIIDEIEEKKQEENASTTIEENKTIIEESEEVEALESVIDVAELDIEPNLEDIEEIEKDIMLNDVHDM